MIMVLDPTAENIQRLFFGLHSIVNYRVGPKDRMSLQGEVQTSRVDLLCCMTHDSRFGGLTPKAN
ncbi:hypothetical protein L484_006780 [Morus notabilis]|uniref:Uncharacterized protein n=1 Tax=Morus notabilis TaxID=981085 RepID=W9RG20_9ROSA|nr:hypothetical protein L484_006780 [Morus notabilis]